MPGRSVCLSLVLTVALHAQQAIAGRVFDRAGQGTAAALVLRWRVHPELPGLCGCSLGDGGLEQSRHSSGADGRFRIDVPHRGPFQLVAEAGSERSEAVFPVVAGDFCELHLEPACEVAGVVTGPDGGALANVPVVLFPDSSTWARLLSYREPEQRGRTSTDAEGRFRLTLERGYAQQPRWAAFVVPWVQAKGLAMPKAPLLLRPTSATARLRIAMTAPKALDLRIVDAKDAPLVGLAFQHEPGFLEPIRVAEGGALRAVDPGPGRWIARGEGRAPLVLPKNATGALVVPASEVVRARLVGPDGKAMAGARVLWSLDVGQGPPFEWQQQTDADGRVLCAGASGALLLHGFVEVDHAFVPFCSMPGSRRDFGDVAVDRGRTLRGKVLGGDGLPQPHARVALLPAARMADEVPRITYADHGGVFEFAALGRVACILMAEAAGAGMGTATVAADANTVDVRMAEGVTVSGVVRDASGEPAASVWVTLARKRDRDSNEMFGPNPAILGPCTLTDAAGRFTFRSLPAGGDWQLLCDYIQGGAWCGGGVPVSGDGASDVVVSTRVFER
jgi:hypothetical protein